MLDYALQIKRGQDANAFKEPIAEKQKSSSPIGVDSILHQNYRRIYKNGLCLNIMLLGQAGLGKTTLFNTLFEEKLMEVKDLTLEERAKQNFNVSSFLLEENDIKVRINVFDSFSVGTQLKQEEGIEPVVKYVDQQLETFMKLTEDPKRDVHSQDTRVHVCLYFLPPTGHSVSQIDISLMKAIHEKVNIIPIIAKADTLTPDECQAFKKKVMEDLKANNVAIYQDSSVDLKHYPFSVIGADGTYEINGKSVRGRKFRWGVAEVENLEHCDFIPLRNLLIREGFFQLIESTNNLYENYRSKILLASGRKDEIMESDDDFKEKLEKERSEWLAKAKKREEELKQKLEKDAQEKEQEFKKKEKELTDKRESVKQEYERKLKDLNMEISHTESKIQEHKEEGDDDKDDKKKKRRSLTAGFKAGSLRKSTE